MTVFMAFEVETEAIDCDADLERLADDALRALEPLGSVRLVPDAFLPGCRAAGSVGSPMASPGVGGSGASVGAARTSSRSGSASVPVPGIVGDACGEDGVRLPVLGGGEVLISAADIAGVYAPAYPAVDVRLQLMRMRAWLLANAANQKTARGIKRFVVNWLSREQDRAAVRGSSRGAQGAAFGGSFDTDDFFSAAVRKSYGG